MIIKKKKKRQKNITSKGNTQDQYDGSILIMSGWYKNSRHMNYIYIKLYQTDIRGHDMKTYQLFVVPIVNEKIT